MPKADKEQLAAMRDNLKLAFDQLPIDVPIDVPIDKEFERLLAALPPRINPKSPKGQI